MLLLVLLAPHGMGEDRTSDVGVAGLHAPALRHPGTASTLAPPAIPAVGTASTLDAPYVADTWLVAPPVGRDLASLARAVDATIEAPVGLSGYGVLHTTHPERIRAAGAAIAPLGRIVGAGGKKKPTATATNTAPPPPPPNWHLTAIGASTSAVGQNHAGRVVAVLDSGVAYETRDRFVRATGLAGVAFTCPLDLVEGDGWPNDDHQHGTHVTSLITSAGALPGVAPNVGIIPVKVLDAHNVGTEWALVEGIHHAIGCGADVINLSLSFPLGYVPSDALRDALDTAWDAEVVVVAAAGNDGHRELSWPAAARTVVSVGASRPVAQGTAEWTTYTNRSPALDILAPGGDLSADLNGDGFIDGVVAETIDPLDPARLGYWAYQGSSQAAALVSGVAVRALEAGIVPHDVSAAIQQSRGGYDAWDAKLTGTGADVVDLPTTLLSTAHHEDLYVGLVPYLADVGWSADPRAAVTVLDAAGAPLVGVEVLGSLYTGWGVTWPLCVTDDAGTCTLQTAVAGLYGGSGAWAFRVDAVVVDGVAQRPSRAVFASDAAEVVLAALQALPADAWDALGVYWPAGTEPTLGLLREAWAVVDTAPGASRAPFGLLFEADAVDAVPGTLDLDIDGTGLLSSPVGTFRANTLTFDGTGLLSSPVGTFKVVGMDGSGLLSSPIGFGALSLYGGTSGSGLLSSPVGTFKLDHGTLLGSGGGACVTTFGVAEADADTVIPTDLLVGSGAVSVGLAPAGGVEASGATGAVRWP